MTIFITYTFLEGLVKITPFKTDGLRLKSWLSRLPPCPAGQMALSLSSSVKRREKHALVGSTVKIK